MPHIHPLLIANSARRAQASLLSLVAFLAFPGDIHAQGARTGGSESAVVLDPFEVAASQANDYRATQTVTATGVATNLVDTPLAISIIPQTFIEDLAIDHFHQTFRYSSGISIDEFNRASGLVIRGVRVDSPLRDGINIPLVGFTGTATTESIAQVELVRGPASVFFGRAAAGGVVNYVTKRPNFVQKGSLMVSGGSHSYKKALFDYQGFLIPEYEKLAFRIIAGITDTETWKDYEYTKREYISPILRWRPNQILDLQIRYEHVDARENAMANGRTNMQFHEDWANPPADVIERNRTPARQTDAQVIAFLKNRWLRSIGNWAADIGTTRGGLRPFVVATGDLSPFYPSGRRFNTGGPGGDHHYDFQGLTASAVVSPWEWASLRYVYEDSEGYNDEYRAFGFPNGDRTVPYAQRSNVITQNASVHAVDLLFEKEILGVRNRVLIGGRYTRSSTISTSRSFDYSGLQPVVRPDGTVLTGRDIALNYNPFIDPEFDVQNILGDVIPRAPVTGGSQQEYITWRAEFFDRKFNTQVGVSRDKSRGEDYYPSTPTYGFNYRAFPGIVLFASYSKNYLPSGLDVSGPGVLPGEAQLLSPALGEGYDVGIKTDWRENTLTGTLSIYELKNTNIPSQNAQRNFFEEPRNLDNDPGNNVSWRVASGVWESQGLNLDLVWTPKPEFQTLFAYEYNWKAEIVDDPQWLPGTPEHDFQIGRRLSLMPDHAFKLWSKYTFTSGRAAGFSIGGGVRYVGETTGGNVAQPSQYFINPSYTLYDLFLEYTTRRFADLPLSFSLTVENLADHIYTQGGNDQFGNPRTFFLRTSLEF